jgi:hypothetical protein
VNLSADASQIDYAPSVPANWPVVPAFIAPALDELAARPSGSPVLIFKPGAPPGGPRNVFSNFNLLAAQALPGSSVQIDASLVNPAVVPGNVYPNIASMTGTPDGTGPTNVVFSDGASFPDLRNLDNNLKIVTQGLVVSPLTVDDNQTLTLGFGVQVDPAAGATAPSILATPGNGMFGPSIVVGLNSYLGVSSPAGAPFAVGIAPKTPLATNVLDLYLNGGVLPTDRVTKFGPNAAIAQLAVLFVSQETFEAWPFTFLQPNVNTVKYENLTGVGTGQFVAIETLIDAVIEDQVIPPYFGATTLPVAEEGSRAGGMTVGAPGFASHFDINLTGNAALPPGTTATVSLLRNGVPIGVVLGPLAIDGGIVTQSLDGFVSQHVAGDTYTAIITPSAALTAKLTNISGGLR